MNLALYGYGPPEHRQWIMVDCGVTFPGPGSAGRRSRTARYPLPRRASARTSRRSSLPMRMRTITARSTTSGRGLNVPVYASPFTAGLLEAKRNYEKSAIGEVPVTTVQGRRYDQCRPLQHRGVAVNHSIPEPMSLMIRTPLGNVVHTGDWKIDHEPSLGPLHRRDAFPPARRRRRAGADVRFHQCACATASRPPRRMCPKACARSSRTPRAGWRSPPSRRMSAASASIAKAAEAAGREVLLLGSSLKRVVDVARDIGLMEGVKPFIAEDEFGYIPRDKVVVILTGSQGESRAALAKISRDEMRNVALDRGRYRRLFLARHSRQREGDPRHQERPVEQGCIIITDTEALVHVSGHPRRNELQRMYEWTRPKIARAGPWRGRASDGAGRTWPRSPASQVAAGAQRRHPAAGAGSGRGHRRGAAWPDLQGWHADRRFRRDGHRRAQASSPLSAMSRSTSFSTPATTFVGDPDLVADRPAGLR